MRMEAAGLPGVWWKQFSADPNHCLTKIQRQMKEKSGKKRLTLNSLSGAFLVLIIGCIISIATFTLQHCRYAKQTKRITNQNANNKQIILPSIPAVLVTIQSR